MTPEEKKEYMKQYNKQYYIKNKKKEIDRAKIYRENNADKFKESQEKYDIKNPNRKKEYIKNRRNIDETFKLKTNISNLIRASFKTINFNKSSKTSEILGCTFEEFKQHLESKFESWMSWENYGNPKDGLFELNKTWDIDHITPLVTAKTEEDIIRLNHYTNLQPLCSYTNRFVKK
jgi:hypothetical protein